MFEDRIDAAIQLADLLDKYKNDDCVILAVPRGGVPFAKIISKKLGMPLDIVLSKKLSHPTHKEYAIGAVSLSNRVLDDIDDISNKYIEEETTRVRKLLQARYQLLYKDRKPLGLNNKTVIIVDDGIATGLTLASTIQLVHEQRPKEIIIAVPVASQSGLQRLLDAPHVDDVVCIYAPADFRSVGQFYQNFTQVSDEEVVKVLNSITSFE